MNKTMTTETSVRGGTRWLGGVTPFRYPGGKAFMFDEIKRRLKLPGSVEVKAYAEPYAGGAGAEATGMEIEGFGALAQNKGAASVMASLWQVSDTAAPKFMQSFYQGIVADNLSKAGALQRTQNAMIQSETFKDPFYWAPFVIMGNWR